MSEFTRTIYRPLHHWLLIRRKRSEVERFRRIFQSPQGANHISIAHDSPGPGKGRCCKREAWGDTFRRLYSGVRTLYIDPGTGQSRCWDDEIREAPEAAGQPPPPWSRDVRIFKAWMGSSYRNASRVWPEPPCRDLGAAAPGANVMSDDIRKAVCIALGHFWLHRGSVGEEMLSSGQYPSDVCIRCQAEVTPGNWAIYMEEDGRTLEQFMVDQENLRKELGEEEWRRLGLS